MSEIVVREAPRALPISGQEFETLWRVARALAASSMFKDGRQAEQAFARILLGRDLGLSPTESMSAIHIVEGKPELSADLQASMLRTYRSPEGDRYDYRITTPGDKRDTECTVQVRYREPGEKWEVIGEETFGVEDARRAGLIGKDPYRKYPRNMFFARAISNAIAFFCPEVAHAPRMGPAVEQAVADAVSADVPVDVEPTQVVPEEQVVEDPGHLTIAQQRHLLRILDDISDLDQESRLIEALDIVDAPEASALERRIAALNENQAAEVIMRLGPEPRHA